MVVENITKGSVIADNCNIADNFATRFAGLMGKQFLPEGSGLHIIPCNSIHMFFMRFPLDIVFLDKNCTVVHVIESIEPWKMSPVIWKAHSILELPVGTIKRSNTEKGDKIAVQVK